MPYQETLFYSGTPGVNAGVNLYTVPTGKTAIVTEWVFSPTGGQADPYLYIGSIATDNHIAVAHGVPYGLPVRGVQAAGTTTHYKGMYVAHAGEVIHAAGDQRYGYHVVSGLLGDGDLAGRTPQRLGAVRPATVNATGLTYNALRDMVVDRVLVQSDHASTQQVGVRVGAAPLTGWYDWLAPYHVREYEGPWFIPAGTSIQVNSFDGGNRARFAAFGWLL